MYPMEMKKVKRKQAEKKAEELLLSAGGSILLADEPTGNLDTENERHIVELLKKLAHEDGYTVIVITHNPEVAKEADANGNLMENHLPGLGVEIVDEAFYKSGHDKLWEAWVREKEMVYHTVPVTATDDLNLMMAYYTGSAYVGDGNTLLPEDFENGNQVCLVPFSFARRNGIAVGDALHLRFSYANYAESASAGWGNCSLTADGEQFETFFEADYTVAGIYHFLPAGNLDTGYVLHENEIIIPAASIETGNENHIGFAGRMKPYNTSFRIPNGTIDEFMTEWEAKGIDDVEIHFYDKGYSKLEAGIKQMERMALILVGAGMVMAILVMVFFCHLMITKQKKRTAVERSLGASKK